VIRKKGTERRKRDTGGKARLEELDVKMDKWGTLSTGFCFIFYKPALL